jgi:hypothetical protein
MARGSVLLIQRWLVPLIRLGQTGRRHIAPDLIYDRVDTAPDLPMSRLHRAAIPDRCVNTMPANASISSSTSTAGRV